MRDPRGSGRISFTVLLIIFIILVSNISFGVIIPSNSGSKYISNEDDVKTNYTTQSLPIKYDLHISGTTYSGRYTGPLTALVTFKLTNEPRLLSMLDNISNPKNPEYHVYISRDQFTVLYSPGINIYNRSVSYFEECGLRVHIYSDRISLLITGNSNQFSNAFGANFGYYFSNGKKFFSIEANPTLPAYIAKYVSQVTGLDDYSSFGIDIGSRIVNTIPNFSNSRSNDIQQGYPLPVYSSGAEYVFGSDLQVAYDEQGLLGMTYPINEVIATILWSGNYSGPGITTSNITLHKGEQVGPYDPSDINAYFNYTLPAQEPHSKVIGVPLGGAPEPGITAQYDSTGANYENTLDLEMIGSTAPGSTILNVYTANSSSISIDESLAFILNPNSTYSILNNVSVISNSWGGPDENDSAWYEYLQEAEARGITVMASSGDSGDNGYSSMFFGSNYSNDWTEFPSAMAYNGFGVTAVGGTTLNLSLSEQIDSQIAWNISSTDYSDNGPAGSTGGVSQVFPEPEWQVDSAANEVIHGEGRGVPDISAISNNTITFITIDGIEYYGNPEFAVDWGTSISSPVTAGMIAEIDAVLSQHNESNLGYLNPFIYSLANQQIQSPYSGPSAEYIENGHYNSSLPLIPFYIIDQGRNDLYNANYGYNLVTGWGSIDAYNLTTYALNINYSSTSGALKGVEDDLSITMLNATTILNNGTEESTYNASVRQSLFIANSLGAPIYWVQNVIYFLHPDNYSKGEFEVQYSGRVTYPFTDISSNTSVEDYCTFGESNITLPYVFNITSSLVNLGSYNAQMVDYQVNSSTYQLPVPGAAYIIGSLNYTWNGEVPNDFPFSGELSPHFSMAGGKVGGEGIFYNPTSAIVKPMILPLGSRSFYDSSSEISTLSFGNHEAKSTNLEYHAENGTWIIGIRNGSLTQYIVASESLNFDTTEEYNISIAESGLPAGTAWYIDVDGLNISTFTNTTTVQVLNGTYEIFFHNASGYRPSVYSAYVDVRGNDVFYLIDFMPIVKVRYAAYFFESGLPNGTEWSVIVNGTSSTSISNGTIVLQELNGTYSYDAYTSNSDYAAKNGSFTVAGKQLTIEVIFHPVTFPISFKENGLPSWGKWYVNITGQSSSGALNSSSSYKIGLQNGTYAYSAEASIPGYLSSDYDSNFTINGTSETIVVGFKEKVYNVTFEEEGLENGTFWSILFDGSNYSTQGSSLTFFVINGTYYFRLENASFYVPSPSNGEVSVTGHQVTVVLTFSPVLAIRSNGYLNGTVFPVSSVIFVDGVPYSTDDGHYNISLSPGTYTVRVTAKGYASYFTSITITSQQISTLPIINLQKEVPFGRSNLTIISTVAILAVLMTAVFLIIRRRGKN